MFSLFRMLGQADEGVEAKHPSRKKSEDGDKVNHASTFPPEGVIDDSSED